MAFRSAVEAVGGGGDGVMPCAAMTEDRMRKGSAREEEATASGSTRKLQGCAGPGRGGQVSGQAGHLSS